MSALPPPAAPPASCRRWTCYSVITERSGAYSRKLLECCWQQLAGPAYSSCWSPAYSRILQHAPACSSILQLLPAYSSMLQHTPACSSCWSPAYSSMLQLLESNILQHAPAAGVQHTPAASSILQHAPACSIAGGPYSNSIFKFNIQILRWMFGSGSTLRD